MRYLKDNHRVYLLLLVVILVFDSLLMLCNIDISLIIYPNVIVLFIVIIYAIYDYYKYKNKALLTYIWVKSCIKLQDFLLLWAFY